MTPNPVPAEIIQYDSWVGQIIIVTVVSVWIVLFIPVGQVRRKSESESNPAYN